MNKNKKLSDAKKYKRDSLLTLMPYIEKELKNYAEQFKNKVVYCNCDTTESNFYKYFVEHFEELKLKELIISGIHKDWKNYTGVEDGTYAIRYFGKNKQIERLRHNV